VLNVVKLDELEPWHDAGLQILKSSRDGGEAYFRLQSTRGEDMLENLSARVELTKGGRGAAALLQGTDSPQRERPGDVASSPKRALAGRTNSARALKAPPSTCPR
jgi:hypothetical protein